MYRKTTLKHSSPDNFKNQRIPLLSTLITLHKTRNKPRFCFLNKMSFKLIKLFRFCITFKGQIKNQTRLKEIILHGLDLNLNLSSKKYILQPQNIFYNKPMPTPMLGQCTYICMFKPFSSQKQARNNNFLMLTRILYDIVFHLNLNLESTKYSYHHYTLSPLKALSLFSSMNYT